MRVCGLGDLGWDALWSVSREGVRALEKLSRKRVARESRPRPPPPRAVTRVGVTSRLQSAAPITHTRSVSRSRRADNPAREGEGARRRRKGRKGLLDSRRRAGAPPPALGVRSLRHAGHMERTLRSAPAPWAPHRPDGVALRPRRVVLGPAASSGSNLPAPPPPPGHRVLARRRPPTPSSAPEARPQRGALRPRPHVLAQAVGTQRH